MSEVNLEQYSNFIQGLELHNIYLAASRTEVKAFPNGDGLFYHLDSESQGPLPVNPDPEGREGFQAATRYSVLIFDHEPTEGETAEPLAVIEAVWAAVYTSPRQPTQEEFNLFAQQNLPVNIWPYFRYFVHNATSHMGFPQLVLPTFKLLAANQNQAAPNDPA